MLLVEQDRPGMRRVYETLGANAGLADAALPGGHQETPTMRAESHGIFGKVAVMAEG